MSSNAGHRGRDAQAGDVHLWSRQEGMCIRIQGKEKTKEMVAYEFGDSAVKGVIRDDIISTRKEMTTRVE